MEKEDLFEEIFQELLEQKCIKNREKMDTFWKSFIIGCEII